MNVDTNIVIAYLADDRDVVHFIDELKANKNNRNNNLQYII